eukprot:8565277-Alexandrium_andersonii.AAC.1
MPISSHPPSELLKLEPKSALTPGSQKIRNEMIQNHYPKQGGGCTTLPNTTGHLNRLASRSATGNAYLKG